MDKENLQRIAWTVPDLRTAVVINERGVATQGIGGDDVSVLAQKADRAVRTLDRVGRSLRLGRVAAVGVVGRGASAFVDATDQRRVVALLGGEVRDLESTLSTMSELLNNPR